MIGRAGVTRRKGFATLALAVGTLACDSAIVGCGGGGGSADDMDGGSDGTVQVTEDRDQVDAKADSKADGGASAMFSKPVTSPLTFPAVPCGGAPEKETLTVTNKGASMLAVSAATAGDGFSVSPSMIQVQPGKSGTLTISASAPSSATAGVAIVGALNLDTNDPTQHNLTYSLSATPTGPTLSITPEASFEFPLTLVGSPAAPLSRVLTNTGNAPGTFTFGTPTSSLFSLSVGEADGGSLAVTLTAGETGGVTAGFTPSSATVFSATSSITASGATCGTSALSVSFGGVGAVGNVTGWPATVDFGPTACGGSAPADQTFTLTNTGPVDAHVTSVSLTGAPGFTTSATVGRTIFASGGFWTCALTAPAVPANSAVTPVTATLTIETDADTSPHVITLTEEPSGAILSFDTSPTPNFGSFGPVLLLGSATQPFNVRNTGSAPASVTLVASANGVAGASPFSVAPAGFTVGPGYAQTESATFTPLDVPGVTGSIAMTGATGSICGTLPPPILLSGSGLGGGPVVTSSSLAFLANCGGTAPKTQSFMVENNGTANFTWFMGAPSGPGAAQYTVTASPPPGLLIPGASATVTVAAQSVPSPAPNPAPSAFAAQLAITTDVPLDPTHVVSLGLTPLGDQLSFSTLGPVRFGQVPVETMLSQPFTLTNSANPGSPPASVSFGIGGAGAGGYQTPAPLVNLAPGAAASENIVFFPTSDESYIATLGALTLDALCTPLPTPLQLSGTGTQAVVSVSAATLSFGTDPNDPLGLVNCGATGLGHSVTVSNVGNQAFEITNLSLGHGETSPFTLSGAATTLPATVPIGGSTTLVITPSPIPENVANPNDATAFADTLTITTNAALDTPHSVQLVMQARGAVIANTSLATSWPFGTVTFGSIGTFTSTIQNTGNAGVSIALKGLAQPSIFGLQSNPTIAGPNAVTSLVGQFTPPNSNGQWSDSGILSVTAQQAFCEPLPSAWSLPTISVSGSSNSNPSVTVSGNLSFPSTDCGSPAPAGQPILLSNATNVAYTYKASFSSGKYYTLSSPASGPVPANGSAMVIVTPTTVAPGAGVTPGSAPYADDLILSVSTVPPLQWTIPISWALNGAVFTLPSGAGTKVDGSGNHFYPADSTTGFLLSLMNTGTAPADVDLAIAPPGAFTFSPAPPVEVIPFVGATPELISSSSDLVCPAVTVSTATFVYSGPVCQPFSLPQVTIEACYGTF